MRKIVKIITFTFLSVGKEKEEINQQDNTSTRIDISVGQTETSKSPG